MNWQESLVQVLNEHIETGDMTAASIYVGRREQTLFEWTAGRVSWSPDSRAVTPNDVFLIASITKPMVTTTFATLMAEHKLKLSDLVAKYVPEFGNLGKGAVTLEHCFTHTSGLLDMVPGDIELRKRNAPLSDYVAAACGSELLFEPGADVRYQSSGILMLSEVARRVTGKSMRDLTHDRLFAPIGMESTDLGWRADFLDRRVDAKVVHGPNSESWNHNSPYWKNLCAPWGGAHSTAADIAALLRTVSSGGLAPNGARVFSSSLAKRLVTDRIPKMRGVATEAPSNHGWGLGWVIKRGGGAWSYSAPIGAFGHSGATGTVAWADERSGVILVLLTNVADGPDVRGACCDIVTRALCA